MIEECNATKKNLFIPLHLHSFVTIHKFIIHITMEIRERYKPPAQPSIPQKSKVHTKNEIPFLLFSIILGSIVIVALAFSCYLFVFKTPISSNFKLFPDRTSNPLLHHGKLEIVAELSTPPVKLNFFHFFLSLFLFLKKN